MSFIKGLWIHIGALAVAVALALSAYTRDEKPLQEDKSEVEVYPGKPAQIETISFESKSRTVKLVSKKDDFGQWFVGKIDRVEEAAPDPHAGVPGAPAPKQPKERKVVEFVSVTAANELADLLAPLKALRDVGPVDKGRLEEFGLDKPEGTLKVKLGGKEHTLTIASVTPGGSERYARYGKDGHVYVVTNEIMQDLMYADSRLLERDLHGFKPEEVTRLKIAHGDKSREVVPVPEKKDGWAPAAHPQKLDETVGNWMAKVGRFRVMKYVDPSGKQPEKKDMIVRLDYYDAKKPIGFLELYKMPGEDKKYQVKTEQSRWFVEVLASSAEQVEQDLDAVLK